MFFCKAMIPDAKVMPSAEFQCELNTPHQWLLVFLPVQSTVVNNWVW